MTDGNGGNAGEGGASATVDLGTKAGGADAAAAAAAAKGAGGEAAAGAADPAKAGGEGAAPDFKTQLGDLGKDPAFDAFKDLNGLAKAYKDTKSALGKAQGIPGADATPEQKAEFYKALGVPETAEAYGLVKPEGLPEKMGEFYEKEMLGAFAKTAKDLNLTPEQAQGLQKWYDDMSLKQLEGLQGDIDKSDEAFGAEMVKAFGSQAKAEAAQAAAQVVAEKYLSPEMRSSLSGAPANVLAAVAMIAQGLSKDMTGEDFTLDRPTTGSGKFSGMDAEALRAKGRELQASEAFKNSFHAGHQAAKDEVTEIYQLVGKLIDAGKDEKGKKK